MIYDLDESLENADWIKQAWDLPPYKSAEFFKVVPLDKLAAFRVLPVYQAAVAKGLIHDDEWVGDYVIDPVEEFARVFADLVLHGPPKGWVKKRAVDARAHEAATSHLNDTPAPTDPQKHAGNYVHGHINVGGLDISIENPAGTRRRPEWETMKAHYGYVKLTTGNDGEQIDVFVAIGTDDLYHGPVYVVDQVKPDGSFDEHKCLVGWYSRQKAIAAYLGSYQKGWKLGRVTKLSWAQFKGWVEERVHQEPLV